MGVVYLCVTGIYWVLLLNKGHGKCFICFKIFAKINHSKFILCPLSPCLSPPSSLYLVNIVDNYGSSFVFIFIIKS